MPWSNAHPTIMSANMCLPPVNMHIDVLRGGICKYLCAHNPGLFSAERSTRLTLPQREPIDTSPDKGLALMHRHPKFAN